MGSRAARLNVSARSSGDIAGWVCLRVRDLLGMFIQTPSVTPGIAVDVRVAKQAPLGHESMQP